MSSFRRIILPGGFMLIYKIIDKSILEKAKEKGSFAGASIDLEDGYIHFSTAETLIETCRLHFREQQSLALFAVESEDLGPALKWEKSRGGQLFPHLYSELATDQIKWSSLLPLDENQKHLFPDLETGK